MQFLALIGGVVVCVLIAYGLSQIVKNFTTTKFEEK